MRPSSSLLLAFISACCTTSANPLQNSRHKQHAPPRRTSPAEVFRSTEDIAPVPTPAPKLRYRNAKIEPRSKGSDTCGFWSSYGETDWQTLLCHTEASCQTSGTVFGCRDEPYTGCIDASSPSSLTSLCGNDDSYDGNICCVTVAEPTCFMFVQNYGLSSTVTNHRCWQSMFGQWNAQYLDTTTGSIAITSIVITRTALVLKTLSSTASSTAEAASESSSSGGSGVSGAAVSTTGAIVGGVVGGVTVIAIAVCVIVWLILRHKRQRKEEYVHPMTPGPLEQFSMQPYVASPGPGTPRYLSGFYEPEKYQPVPIIDPSSREARGSPSISHSRVNDNDNGDRIELAS
ncbi:hypothetical protein CGCF415_v008097 [Colletotrichum fructicola]|uniref:Uncharacterized protein n=2 Tax=Colletotrichum fructicola (strain Nara gc5) TaxID=1213859 RepID=A0A7J6JRL5_COLFN|nr:uncharacterized protein CGMCC3_g7117 [Colletotrichum fructicola]KAF4492741.1 hypothetical protein CGGC5_v001435 [Colletotrichum fructicola Nara gc5]KAE9576883.1 hypothetical protein CGMCC3_g7117 [Colletotrichum fructicola]KAF4413165.1 hypothetical protein CFRS1_v004183 [Colletotrichum fructicola]KAF4906392.1 hypothetical protein CGCF415_v008097 [Colletotrichum fructicola]KAF5514069.1 hypothetical protein CGCF413_v001395 [Colletotrichum fructicola]